MPRGLEHDYGRSLLDLFDSSGLVAPAATSGGSRVCAPTRSPVALITHARWRESLQAAAGQGARRTDRQIGLLVLEHGRVLAWEAPKQITRAFAARAPRSSG